MSPSSDQPLREAPGTAAQFATTHWSMVLEAGQGASKEANQALEILCRSYWYPLENDAFYTKIDKRLKDYSAKH